MIARTFLPRLLLIIAMAFGIALPAHAQFDVLPEVRAGVMMHDAGLFDPANIRDANVELLFSIPALETAVGEVRPHIGATVNFDGKESLVYSGLSLTFRVPVLPVFLEAGLGGALHDESLDANKTRFGCAALAQAQASVGLGILPGVSLIGTVQHATDFGMCGTPNNGLTTAGLRLGIRF